MGRLFKKEILVFFKNLNNLGFFKKSSRHLNSLRLKISVQTVHKVREYFTDI